MKIQGGGCILLLKIQIKSIAYSWESLSSLFYTVTSKNDVFHCCFLTAMSEFCWVSPPVRGCSDLAKSSHLSKINAFFKVSFKLEKKNLITHFLKFVCNWRIIALQYCVGLCHTSIWISHRHTHVPSPLNLLPTALGCHSTSLNSLHHAASFHWLSISHMVAHVFILLSPFAPPSPLASTSTSLFSMPASLPLPCNISSAVPSF